MDIIARLDERLDILRSIKREVVPGADFALVNSAFNEGLDWGIEALEELRQVAEALA